MSLRQRLRRDLDPGKLLVLDTCANFESAEEDSGDLERASIFDMEQLKGPWKMQKNDSGSGK